MKRFLCILLCLLLAAPAALADTYTPTQLFRQQFIIGGNGLRGTVSIKASGVAEWLDLILPFTSTKLQVRIIGEQQGAMSDLITDDEDWQVKLWVKDAQGEQQALTCIYGGPEAMFISSELLPGTLLTLPVQGVNLPFQLADGELLPLLGAFDPLGVTTADNGGNATAWSALTQLFSIPGDTWEADWAPVLAKYETLMDMWLAEYATPTVVSGSAGSMTLRTSYEIPAADIKAQAKYLIGLMMTDVDLLTLAAPCLTDDQRSLYLNPAMLWFYEYCIDQAPLNGSILLERETTIRGETVAMTISLPLPTLPAELTGPLGEVLRQTFSLPYADAFEGVDRISVRQAGDDFSLSLTSARRTITLSVADLTEQEDGVTCAGFLRITPAVGVEEPPLSAAFSFAYSHKIWDDEDYSTHEDFTLSLEVTPDMSLASEDDPFHSTYVEFAPLAFSASVGYIKKDKAASPVQLQIGLSAVLTDAEVSLDASLKVAERWAHDVLPVSGGEDVSAMTPERAAELRTLFIENAIRTMSNLTAPAAAPAQ